MTVAHDETMIYITIVFNSESDVPNAGNFVYMYGANRHVINFNAGSFKLRKDAGADGHFEEVVYSGLIANLSGNSIQIEVPAEYIPDIVGKKIWAYSMASKDRIPNKN